MRFSFFRGAPRKSAALIAMVSLASVLSIGCDKPAPSGGPAPPPPAVGVSIVSLREISPADDLTGRVEAVHDVEVRARVSGYVTSVNYHEGAEVPNGAVLFTIDARPYQAVLARANADLTRDRAAADLARDESARAEKLVASNAIPGTERDKAVSTAAQASAQTLSAQAAVDLAKLDVDFTQVRAPLAGKTGQALVSVGDFVSAGPAPTLLTTVASIDPVYVYFTGDEDVFLRFASGSREAPVAIGLEDETGHPHVGKIDFVDNHLDSAAGTIRLRAIVPNPDRRLTPGLYARVQLGEGKSLQAILIDDKAVLTDQDRKYVYVLNAADTVERRDVKLGRIVDGLRLIDTGLKPGDRVIINGTQKVMVGSKATVAPVIAEKDPSPSKSQ